MITFVLSLMLSLSLAQEKKQEIPSPENIGLEEAVTEKQAENGSITAATTYTLPKWNMNFSSYYYSFQGERPAVTGLYDFGKISTRMDFFNINYSLPKYWSINVLLQHYDSYIESLFPTMTDPALKQSNDRIAGLSDTYMTVIAPIKIGFPLTITADFGVSLPTGAIDIKAVNLPGFETYHMAYNAQLGSGTVDGLAGATVLYMQPNYVIGSRVFANIRTGRNKFDYRLGNQYRLDTWFDYNFKNGITPRFTAFYRHKDAIDGFDEVRGKNPADNFFYNKQINWDVSAALRYKKQIGTSKLAMNAEAGIPIAQDNINVDNTFVRTQYYVSLGLGAAF